MRDILQLREPKPLLDMLPEDVGSEDSENFYSGHCVDVSEIPLGMSGRGRGRAVFPDWDEILRSPRPQLCVMWNRGREHGWAVPAREELRPIRHPGQAIQHC